MQAALHEFRTECERFQQEIDMTHTALEQECLADEAANPSLVMYHEMREFVSLAKYNSY